MIAIRLRRLLVCSVALLSVLFLVCPSRVDAQCPSVNCSLNTPPAACQNLAAPRTLVVNMQDFSYIPSDPKIEPGDCIEWAATVAGGFPHTSTDSANLQCANMGCPGCAQPTCDWETGNTNQGVSSFCSYNLSPSTKAFCCRFHDLLGMNGNMTTTSTINITSVQKTGSAIVFSWIGGGGTYKVKKSNNDPQLLPANTNTLPAVGSATSPFTDVGELNQQDTHYYFVRNMQSNDP